ncbi:NADH/NAD(+) kinase [Martiniozyma asiatica (nom. inval.)]|nr:NADH/NAD(+) kinase [Martiniozyma asiatica]
MKIHRSSSTVDKEPIIHSCLTLPVKESSPMPTTLRSALSHMNLDTSVPIDECELINSLKNSPDIKPVRSHADLAKTVQSVRSLNTKLNRATVHLETSKVVIITKARDNSLVYLTKEMTEWLLQKYPKMCVYVDAKLKSSKRFDEASILKDIPNCTHRLGYWTRQSLTTEANAISFVITLGGDGTVLHASTLFQTVVPPIVSFSLGSLGFLTTFPYENFRQTLTDAINEGVHTALRMRFTCRVHSRTGEIISEHQVLNEVVIDRGPSPYVTMLELYGDGSLLTIAQADGLIIATPTGSTAYNLSAGGSLVHPEVSCICITPICAHTLSFRPVMVPDSMVLDVKVPFRSRGTAWAAFDGRTRVEVRTGEWVSVKASLYPFPTVKGREYFESVSGVLGWNVRKEQKSLGKLLNEKNRKKLEGEVDETDEDDWDVDYSED